MIRFKALGSNGLEPSRGLPFWGVRLLGIKAGAFCPWIVVKSSLTFPVFQSSSTIISSSQRASSYPRTVWAYPLSERVRDRLLSNIPKGGESKDLESAFKAWADSRNSSPFKDLLRSTGFRASLQKGLKDLPDELIGSDRTSFAAAMLMGCELVDEVDLLRKEVC